VRSHKVKSTADYAATSSSGWQAIAPERVELVPAPLGLQPNGFIQANWRGRSYGETPYIEAQAVHDGSILAVRLRWPAAAPANGSRDGFSDGAAIAFPVVGEPVLWSMGADGEPVHFIQWQALKNSVRSVIAWGIGTSVPAATVGEAVNAGWSQGFWTIVLMRALAGGAEAAGLKPGTATGIGFAVWNGTNEERGGIKAVAPDWTPLELDA
jgi:DMSO reductase family type II enzyme heme b subunit